MEGKIIRMQKDKGFGFIKTDGGDHFFHRNACINRDFDSMEIGDQVKFRSVDNAKGLRAEEVEVIP